MRVAIFDFDGTLYSKETFKLLMAHLKQHPVYKNRYKQFFRSILPLYIGYKMKIVSEAKMKEQSMLLYLESLQSLSDAELDSFFREMTGQVQRGFNEQVVDLLRSHKENGYFLMLVSGAYTPFLQAVTGEIPFDRIIGTEIPDKKDTLRNSFVHIQGERKNEQIYKALSGLQVDWEHSVAYGDSASDLPVLELVGNPVAVQPDKTLESIAKQRGWQLI